MRKQSQVIKSAVAKSNAVCIPAKLSTSEKALFNDLRELIDNARRKVAVTVNAETIMMYWSVGMRIRTEILKNKRAAYGEEIVLKVSEFLTSEFGNGWGFQTVRHCVRAAYTFSKKEIVYALRTQLNWTHLRTMMSMDDALKRQFYFEMCAHEHWSTRELTEKIDGMLYERTAISKKPENLIKSASLNTSPGCRRRRCSNVNCNVQLQSLTEMNADDHKL